METRLNYKALIPIAAFNRNFFADFDLDNYRCVWNTVCPLPHPGM